jgi:hypothetical protein
LLTERLARLGESGTPVLAPVKLRIV